jgi:3-oxoacyl-[acyl-carrier protein] reductase
VTAQALRSALVTGASRGIGLGIASRLAAQGYALTISGRREGTLTEAADILRQRGSPYVQISPGDMSDPDDLARLSDSHAERFKTMNALILNAGVGTAGLISETSLRRFDKTVAVNFRGQFILLRHSLPMLRAAARLDSEHGARIVALASITGAYAEARMAAYGATKAALLSLVAAVNAEESVHRVTATAIAPAFVNTDMTTWAHDKVAPDRMIEINDVVEMADAVLRLSANAVVPQILMSRAGTDGYCA